MKIFWKYIFPPLYGLLVYFTIRLLLDTVSGMKFWHRSWLLNGPEMVISIMMGYLLVWIFEHLFRYFDRRWTIGYTYERVVRELLYVFVVNTVVQNAIITPFAAFTDDGLQWYDVADINTIPALYAFIYYGIRRSQTFLKAYIDNKVQLEKITNDQLQTELKFLKAQYHPHFLFNALNTIYFQMDEDVKGAKRTVEKFSELLRYQLYDQQQTVSVNQELLYLQNFIDLQRVRSSDKLQLQVNFDDRLNGQQVYPLLFLPLVENAFKYVGGDHCIDIDACTDGHYIEFRVSNSMPAITPATRNGSGIGLDNLKRRLELLYPGQHEFITEKSNGIFSAKLKILSQKSHA